jgi:hypothetical protein
MAIFSFREQASITHSINQRAGLTAANGGKGADFNWSKFAALLASEMHPSRFRSAGPERIETKLGFQMCRFVLGIADGAAIFCSPFRISNRNRPIDGWVTGSVRSIMRQRAQRKCMLVGILAFEN